MMKAMILAAGRGKRMRPLTDALPKPLLAAGRRRLIDWSLDGLYKAGIREAVVNIAHLADTFEPILGHERGGMHIEYSREGNCYEESLETLGGIVKALPMLTDGREPFIVVAGDIVSDYDFSSLIARRDSLLSGLAVAHLVLVPNPGFHPEGDMGLLNGRITCRPKAYTYSSIGLFSPEIFKNRPVRFEKLFPWLYGFVEKGLVSGELYTGYWGNIGTPQDLAALEEKERENRLSSK